MLAILWREWKTHLTKPLFILNIFGVPLFFLCFFAVFFSANLPEVVYKNRSLNYIAFFTPGLIAIQSFQTFSRGISLVFFDRKFKIVETILTTPTSIYEYIAGKLVITQLVVIFQAILILSISGNLSSYIYTISGVCLLVITLLLGTSIWFILGILLGILLHHEDTRDLVIQACLLPITFLSTAYYPLERGPKLLVYITKFNPLTYISDLLRDILTGNLHASAVCLNFVILFVFLSVVIGLLFTKIKDQRSVL